MSIKFSVIIPAYNAEMTIDRCLSSILHSERNDVEVLVINDGSTDNTGEICRNVSKKDGRVKYYEKPNGGVSSARNKGIELASGEFVCFADSDDFVSPDYFEQLDRELQDNCDFLMFGKKIFDGTDYKYYDNKGCYCDNMQETVAFLCDALRKQLLNAPCDKVYKLSLIKKNDISFPEQLHIGEDKVFVVRYLMTVQSVKCINKPLYIISTENNNSLSRKAREDLCNSILLEHNMIFEAVMKSKLSEKYKKMYFSAINFSYYRSAYTVIAEMNKFDLSEKEKKNRIKDICRKYSSNSMKKYCALKDRIIAFPVEFKLVHFFVFMLKLRS